MGSNKLIELLEQPTSVREMLCSDGCSNFYNELLHRLFKGLAPLVTMETQLRVLLKSLEHPSTMVSRGLRQAFNLASITARGRSILDGQYNFF